jgi:uncharacterized protein YfaS (alpha-2-macroglobulin family)
MKTTLFAGCVTLMVAYVLASPRDELWKKVEDAAKQGLPQTAIAALEPIIQQALADKAWPEAVKAIARKVTLEAQVQGGRPEEGIIRLEKETSRAPKEIRPLLDTILANWHWRYFEVNRWRFMERSPTAAPPGDDFTTWDLPRLFAKVDQQFLRALSASQLLKATPIGAYDEFLQKGTVPDAYRPTLYDFVAHEALVFYSSAEQAAALPQDTFEVSADSEILAPAGSFLAWQPAATDTNSPIFKAITCYQDLLRFHRNDSEPSAFLDADLARLAYGKNVSYGDSKLPRYKAALKDFAQRNRDHALASLALYYWAQALQEEGNLAEAHQIATQGKQAHPTSPGGQQCSNLLLALEQRSLQIATERVWNRPFPKIQVRYRNVTNVFFRAIALNWENLLLAGKFRFGELQLRQEDYPKVPEKAPALSWTNSLTPTRDFKTRTAELPAPESLPPGYYLLVASQEADFSRAQNELSLTSFWVSNLALVLQRRPQELMGLVLEARSGEPVVGAAIEAWKLDRQGKWLSLPAAQTDDQGSFSLALPQGVYCAVRASHQGHQVTDDRASLQTSAAQPEHASETRVFTDRAIYRPGQTVHYKGICLMADPKRNDYHTLAGEKVVICFRDPNGKEIARREHRANDYGSFAGSFTAPQGRLLGGMTLEVVKGPAGSTAIEVAEYKRPKFQVTLAAPKTAPKLGEKVSLSGLALAYTGAPVDNAQVAYRVTRQVRLPWWWGYFGRRRSHYQPQAASQEITHGTVKTAPDGSFQIQFLAKADPAVPETDEPTFDFSVSADVTDSAGETRSAERLIRVGYTALQARVSASDWQTDERPVELILTTTSLDDEPQTAEGSLTVHELQAPEQVHRPSLFDQPTESPRYGARVPGDQADGEPLSPNLSDPNNWPLGKPAHQRGFTTDKEGKATIAVKLPVGLYRVLLQTQDRFGQKVTAVYPLQVLRPAAERLDLKIPNLVVMQKSRVEPGEEFLALWGSGYPQARAFVEIEHRGQILRRYWTKPGQTQALIKGPVTEAMRGGFQVRVTQVTENRAYFCTQEIEVPWSNKELKLTWEHFTSKLLPGQPETWTAVITGPKAEKVVAEMAATLYDASLEAFTPHSWQTLADLFYRDISWTRPHFANAAAWLRVFHSDLRFRPAPVDIRYRSFPSDVLVHSRFSGQGLGGGFSGPRMMAMVARSGAPVLAEARAEPVEAPMGAATAVAGAGEGAKRPKPSDLGRVSPRKNLQETAFFYAQLLSDTNGVVRLTFTMPEALTEWRFFGLAHDRACRSGLLEGKTVTARDLMVQPNPPRFFREGDVLEFTVKVSNQSDQRQTGKVRLTFSDVLTEQITDRRLGNRDIERAFDIPAKQSRSFSWQLTVPDGQGPLSFKAVAASDKFSDGEEGLVPVLPRRTFVIESLPLPIRGPASKQFHFARLADSAKAASLQHQSLTLQMVSQPAWYAVMALPYLMEFPHECTEQTFNRFYANSLARFIANSDPKIRQVFEQWKATPALDSPLEKNAELKSVAVEETPWLRQAQGESQARKNVGLLFDNNQSGYESDRAWEKLAEAQLPDGAWPWFPGGQGNNYISLYITTGFGRLRGLGVDVRVDLALRSLQRLDGWSDRTYRAILRQGDKEQNHLSSTIALYLYGRSFFLKEQAIPAQAKEAVNYFLAQAKKYWLELDCRQSQGHLALALWRFGDTQTAQAILKSLKERSVYEEELGRFWRDTELSWWWHRAPIETQALMMEAFAEVMSDAKTVEECQVWLLKQKQTQGWKTTKATADAVYALLLRGRNLLASAALVEVSLGGQTIRPEKVEAGTGFYERRWAGPEVKPAFGRITVKKTDPGVSWGSLHWQYLEDMTKVKAYEGTPLKLRKGVFVKKNTHKGPALEAVKGPVSVGDELVVRIELRVDRDMEYVHLKDQRGSGTEPLNVLSGYRYQDGLAYYEVTRDTASHFFIDYLPKGAYVFEYSTRIVHRGAYQTGLASIQCMYAPEFNSHSESSLLTAR